MVKVGPGGALPRHSSRTQRLREIGAVFPDGEKVGDPLKDTSGPALNIVVKLTAIISLVLGSAIAQYSSAGRPVLDVRQVELGSRPRLRGGGRPPGASADGAQVGSGAANSRSLSSRPWP